MEEFKKRPLEERKKKSQMLMSQDQSRIPVVIGKAPRSKLPEMKKPKMLIPKNFRITYVVSSVRNELKLKEDQAVNIYSGSTLLNQGSERSDPRQITGRTLRVQQARGWVFVPRIL